METLVERATQSLSHHPSPALPLDELSEHVRHGGHVVGPGVLLRALEARTDLFRVLDPWRGPWRAAAPRPGRTCAARPQDHALEPPGHAQRCLVAGAHPPPNASFTRDQNPLRSTIRSGASSSTDRIAR